MKLLIINFVIFCFLSLTTQARKVVSVSTGSWNSPFTWLHNYLPQGGDTIEIEAGHTVIVSGSHNVSGNKVVLIISVLNLNVGGHLSLPASSSVALSNQGQLRTNNRHTHNLGMPIMRP